jgi:hypothetical protein
MKSSTIFLEIVGTKDYRKPEWVSQMEEMKEALEGKVPIRILFYTWQHILAINLHTKYYNNGCYQLRKTILKIYFDR